MHTYMILFRSKSYRPGWDVLAATVIAFPLMYRNARAAFEQVDQNLIYAARTLGMSETAIFWKVLMPAAESELYPVRFLTFARALGEYGLTSMFAGNIPGRTSTISQKIAMVIQDSDYATAGFWVAVIMMIALCGRICNERRYSEMDTTVKE